MDKDTVISVLSSNGLNAQSRFGQNFLCDDSVINKIIEISGIKPGSSVLEIGPGLGALTEKAIELGADYTGVEIDRGLFEVLKDTYGDKFICSDYLKLEKESYSKDFDKVISNIPYYVMTPIIKKLLTDCTVADKMTFMVEEDAIDRIIAFPNTKQYGPLAVLCSVYGDVKKEFTVQSSCFYPAPHTTSAVISLTRRDGFDINEDFCEFVEAAFSMRRKTLINSLKAFSKSHGSDIENILDDLGINKKVRAEAIEPALFVSMFEQI